MHKYMADLTEDTGKLYKALCKYLPERMMELVMVPVLTSYKNHFGKGFKFREGF